MLYFFPVFYRNRNLSRKWYEIGIGSVCYVTLIGSHGWWIDPCRFRWPWVTSDPDFKVTTFLMSNIGKRRVLKTKLLLHTILNLWNGAMFGDLDWPLNASHGFVSISWASCLYLIITIIITVSLLETKMVDKWNDTDQRTSIETISNRIIRWSSIRIMSQITRNN